MTKKIELLILGGLFLMMLGLLFVQAEMNPVLRYSRDAIMQGELWRFFTGHMVHVNFMHGLLNLGTFLLILLILGKELLYWQWWLGGFLLCAFISAGLLLFSVNVGWYVGFSGVLHGLLVLGLFSTSLRGDWLHGLVLLGVTAKVVNEQLPSFDVNHLSDMIDAAVVVDAHLYGLIGGFLLAIVFHFREAKRLILKIQQNKIGSS